MAADLHLHTFFSDGTYSPEELAGHAARQRLELIALTDHDTVEGCDRAAAACAAAGVRFLPGSELTAEFAEAELHLLGYGLDRHHAGLLAALGRFQQVRQDRVREMVSRLNHLGIALDADAVLALANCRSPGRPHVARALVNAGVCSGPDEAFARFLRRDRPAWVPKFRMSAEDAIRLIHDAGGLAVLAHPGLNHVDACIPSLVEQGLDGIECFHSRHPRTTTEHYLTLAGQHRLLVTGGSDCHGMAKGTPLIGSVRLPMEHAERLLAALPHRPRPGGAP